MWIQLLLFVSFSCFASFDQWKQDYAKRAAKRGIKASFTLSILNQIKLNKDVINRDKNQVLSSKKIDYKLFIKKWLREDNKRVSQGKALLKENIKLLRRVEKDFGVDKEIIVSLWGVESFYGEITGDYNVIEAMASLAYDGRRRKFYETQLNAAMRLLRAGHVKLEDFKGSWAGATGQCQFMPSNIAPYAVDYDKDGKKDIWKNKADIFASIANLLKKNGWKKGASMGKLQKVKTKNTKEISMSNSPYVLPGRNYKAIIRWNRSSLFVAFNIILTRSFLKLK